VCAGVLSTRERAVTGEVKNSDAKLVHEVEYQFGVLLGWDFSERLLVKPVGGTPFGGSRVASVFTALW